MIINVAKQSISISSPEALVSNSVGQYMARISFSDEWKDFDKIIVFRSGETSIEQAVDAQTEIIVPWEVLQKKGTLEVGAYGLKGTEKRPTIWSKPLVILQGVEEGETAHEPTILPWEEIVRRIGQLADLDTENKSSLVGAINEVLSTVPAFLSELTPDAEHMTVSQAEKNAWSAKADTSDIPTNVSELENDAGYITQEEVPEITATAINNALGYTAADNADVQENAQEISQISESITEISGDVDSHSKSIADAELRIEKLEAAAEGNLYMFHEDSAEAYEKTVLADAMKWATLDKVGGKTLVWNQKVRNPAMTTLTDISGGNCTRTATADGVKAVLNSGYTYQFVHHSLITVQPHKYYICVDVTPYSYAGEEMFCGLALHIGTSQIELSGKRITTKTRIHGVVSLDDTQASTARNPRLVVYAPWGNGTEGDTAIFKNMLCIDLTTMFGAGNEPTAEEFRAMFPADYYPYSEPTLMSFAPNAVTIRGENCISYDDIANVSSFFERNGDVVTFSPDTSAGLYQRGVVINPTSRITYEYDVKNVTGKNFRFRFFYEDGVAQDGSTNGHGDEWVHIKSTTSTQHGNIIAIGANWTNPGQFAIKNLMFTKWDNDKFPAYKPYSRVTTTTEELVAKYFPSGMNSAGEVHDEIDLERGVAIQRVGSVDLGTLNWWQSGTFTQEHWRYTVDKPVEIRGVTSDIVPNWISSEFIVAKYNDVYTHKLDGIIGCNAVDYICSYTTAYNTLDEYKSAMQGVMLYYELAEPIETPIDPTDLVDLTALDVESGGSLTFKNQHGDDYRVPLPNQEIFMIRLRGASNV